MFRSLLLIVPPQIGLLEGFANGIVSLANYVGEAEPDLDVHFLDLGPVGRDQLSIEIRAALHGLAEPVLVGITATTAGYQAALEVARRVKGEVPDAKLVFGGPHASPEAKTVLSRHPDLVDFVIRGEGERALLALVREFPSLDRVSGLSALDDQSYRENPAAPLLTPTELDLIPTTFRGAGLRSAPGKFDHVTYISARGCPLPCAFCAVANEKIRSKTIPRIIEDLTELVVERGFRRIAIEDNFFAHSTRRTLDLAADLETLRREIQTSQGIDFTWDCQTRVESMANPEISVAMRRAGCEAIYLGVESFSPTQLFYLRKASNPQRYLGQLHERVAPQVLASGIDLFVNVQLGIPGTSSDDRDATLRGLTNLGRIAASNGRRITVFPMLHVVYPGTAHFSEALTQKRYGPLGREVFEEFTDWEADKAPIRSWLGEHFAHGTGGIPEGILDLETLRRRGDFIVDAESVFTVIRELQQIASIPNVDVFKYGSYLVKERALRGESQPLGNATSLSEEFP